MTWIILDSSQQAIVDEIEKQTDRGAALVASSFLENRLEQAIKARLWPNPDPAILGKLFNGAAAPLGSFSAKIDLGHLLELYPHAVHWLLHRIRDIRNDFAHEENPISFDTPTVSDRCKLIVPALSEVAGSGFVFCAVVEMDLNYHSAFPLPEGKWELDRADAPRAAYIAAIKLLIFLLTRVRDAWSSRNKEPPFPLRCRYVPPHLREAPPPNASGRKKRARQRKSLRA